MVIARAGADDACGILDIPLPPFGVSSLTSVEVLAAFPPVFLTITKPLVGSPDPAVKHDIDADHRCREQREHEEEWERHPAGSARLGRQDGQKNGRAH